MRESGWSILRTYAHYLLILLADTLNFGVLSKTLYYLKKFP